MEPSPLSAQEPIKGFRRLQGQRNQAQARSLSIEHRIYGLRRSKWGISNTKSIMAHTPFYCVDRGMHLAIQELEKMILDYDRVLEAEAEMGAELEKFDERFNEAYEALTNPPAETQTPAKTQSPVETNTPVVETNPPVETQPPVETNLPVETNRPVEMKAPAETNRPVTTNPPVETVPPIETKSKKNRKKRNKKKKQEKQDAGQSAENREVAPSQLDQTLRIREVVLSTSEEGCEFVLWDI